MSALGGLGFYFVFFYFWSCCYSLSLSFVALFGLLFSLVVFIFCFGLSSFSGFVLS